MYNMSLTFQPNVLNQLDIEYILSLPEVLSAKKEIDSKKSGAILFTIKLTQPIKASIFKKFGLQLDTIPMRWIKGDTLPHIDRGMKDFDKTYLVYLTDSEGQFIVDNESHPIEKGSAFIFNEGVNHKTINTGLEPRLLVGPMSEQGFAVGAGSSIHGTSGTTAYVKEESGNIYYSYDQSSWNTLYWPVFVYNDDVSPTSTFNIEFLTDINIIGNSWYFIINSDYVQLGSSSLKFDGNRPRFIISVNDFDGLIQNGTSYSNSYSNINIFNLIVDGGSYTQQIGAGWLTQKYYGKGGTNNYILNCTSTGDINGGGILGDYAGSGAGSTLTIIGCSSLGSIANQGAGGIFASYAASDSGSIIIESSWSTGSITGDYCGGIVGSYAGYTNGSINIINCYSLGVITGLSSGGITGYSSSNITIQNCYSQGNITGANAGGIIGDNSENCSATNCYSSGNIGVSTAGGIIGNNGVNYTIANCYTSGTVTDNLGYIIGNSNALLPTCYSEAYNSSSGWTETNANTVLIGYPVQTVGVIWITIGLGIPYQLFNMGHSPYLTSDVSGATLSRVFETTVTAGNSTIRGLKNTYYAILKITGGDDNSSITINPLTGAINTARETIPGNYTIYVYNVGSYNITTVQLTVNKATPIPTNTYIPVQRLGLNQKSAFCGTKSVSTMAVSIGAIKGIGSSTRIYNYCRTVNPYSQECVVKTLGFM